jgi:hypothetical protein
MSKNDIQATDLTAAQLGNVLEWATFFFEMGVTKSMSCYYGESILAAASIFAARRVLDIEPVWPEHLYALDGIKDVQDLQTCVGEVLHAYNSNASECPAGVQMPTVLYTIGRHNIKRHQSLSLASLRREKIEWMAHATPDVRRAMSHATPHVRRARLPRARLLRARLLRACLLWACLLRARLRVRRVPLRRVPLRRVALSRVALRYIRRGTKRRVDFLRRAPLRRVALRRVALR